MASKLHKRTLKLLKELLGTSVLEEVNVQSLFKDYPARNEHYDLTIPSYNLVIECHGEQHKYLSSFGEKNSEKIITNFQRQKRRDRQKEDIVWENGWGYVVIWYNELPKDNEEAKKILKKKVLEAIERIEIE